MANISFTDYESKKETRTFPERAKIGYFNSLKEDGDEAVVRLNYDTKADFKVVTVHRVVVDGHWRNIECLKEPYDTNDKCPLCASGDKMKSKIFVQLLQYGKDENGNVVAEPKVWERGYGFVPELFDVIADAVEDEKIAPNTPVRDIVFKVRRIGTKGSMDTKYKLKVMQPAVVPDNVFSKDFSAFKDFDSAYHDYARKTEEEIKYFLENKKFPEKVKEEKKPATTTAALDVDTGELPATEPEHPGAAEDSAVFETRKTTATTTENPTGTKPVRYNW